jgi:hypothetical protein
MPPKPYAAPQQIFAGETVMTKVFIDPRPKGRQAGSRIDDYVVEEEGDRVLKTFKTQEEAIIWA